MNISHISYRTIRWSRKSILEELERLPSADDSSLHQLQQQGVYLLLPDTEHSAELRYLVKQFRETRQVELVADRFEKIPFSGVGQAWEGYCLYATSLFIALNLLRFTTQCYGWLRCALFLLSDQTQSIDTHPNVSPVTL